MYYFCGCGVLTCIVFAPPVPPECTNSGQLRLVNSVNITRPGGIEYSIGRVELCFNNSYEPLCSAGLDTTDARAICGSAGYPGQ